MAISAAMAKKMSAKEKAKHQWRKENIESGVSAAAM